MPVMARAAVPSTGANDTLAAAILGGINSERTDASLHALRTSPALTRAAQAHALSMAQLGYFGHDSADGSSLTRRLAGYYPAGGAIHWAVGEILIWRPGDVTASEALAAWLASSPHRAEIHRPRWREVGVATVHALAAPGVFGGQDVTIAVVDFGMRS